jgi:hypothetical protein
MKASRIVRVLVAVSLGIAALACGGGYPAAPDEATLCELSIGTSTPEEALALLGTPVTDNDAGTTRILGYLYAGAGRDTLRQLSLTFRQGSLASAATSNMPYPACWETPSR